MDNINIKGYVEMKIVYKDGSEEDISGSNMITNSGYRGLLWGMISTGARSYFTEIAFGSNGAEVNRLQDMPQLNIIIKKAISPIPESSFTQTNLGTIDKALSIPFTLEFNEGNGSTIRELGLIFRRSDSPTTDILFSRIKRADIQKTSAIKIVGNWILYSPNEAMELKPLLT